MSKSTKPAKKRKPSIRCRCRDCGAVFWKYRFSFYRAGGVRCANCGGLVDTDGSFGPVKTRQRR